MCTLKNLVFVGVIAFLVSQITSIKVQCQTEPADFKPGKRFFLGQRDVLVPTIYGVNVFVDKLDGFISKAISNYGFWEPRNLRNMARFVKKGDNILNVGSHVALQMVVLGKYLEKECRLFIIQPFSVSHNLALKNVYFNGLGQISSVYNVGAGSAYSKGIGVVNTSNTGVARVFTNKSETKDSVKNYQIIVDTVDSILPQSLILDFVLIDTEGMQLQVLSGMKAIIQRSPNVIIFCEFTGKLYRYQWMIKKVDVILNWFVQLKFKFYIMGKEDGECQYAKWIERTVQQTLEEPQTLDILFVPGHLNPNNIDF